MTKRNTRLTVLAVVLAALAGAVAAKAYDANKSAQVAQNAQSVPATQWISQAPTAAPTDPWAAMQAQMVRMQADMNRMFNQAFSNGPAFPGFDRSAAPTARNTQVFGWNVHPVQSGISHVSISQKGKNYVVTAKLPGSKGNNVQVNLSGRMLSISSHTTGTDKQTGGKGQVISQAQFSSSSEQAFTLPGPVNAAGMKTHFKDGVLTVTIPKATS